jgi:hypothetical protein
MNRRSLRALFLGVLCLALFATIASVPAHAVEPVSSAAESLFSIRQAHLCWMAEVTDVEMAASISYVETLYEEDTSTMTSLYTDFRNAKSAISSVTSQPALDKHTFMMQKIAIAFNRETKNQTNAHQGKVGDLQKQIGNAVTANPYITMKKDAYWSTRSAHQMDDFDSWVTQTQKSLDVLQTQGYSVRDTQPYLDRFASLKTDLKSSLDANDFDRVDIIELKIRDRSLEISNGIAALQGGVSRDKTAEFRIKEADRVISRADEINNQLIGQILDIGDAEPVLSQTKIDVKMAHGALNGGQTGLVSSQLLLIKKDYRDLAAAYRDIAVSANLPGGMADVLKATSVSLENTADRIGEPT